MDRKVKHLEFTGISFSYSSHITTDSKGLSVAVQSKRMWYSQF